MERLTGTLIPTIQLIGTIQAKAQLIGTLLPCNTREIEYASEYASEKDITNIFKGE